MSDHVSIVAPRLDAKPWGGRRLGQFGIDLPEGQIGEALVTAGDAVVSRGFGEGKTLDQIVATDPEGMMGGIALAAVGGRPMFPLLVKLIDASENLSIQVHPDDVTAPEGKLGKTEAWQVLAAEPGAMLYVGLGPDVEFDDFRGQAARLNGSSSVSMRQLPALPGETVLIPAGTIHALGAGVIVYEVQQPSDVTYRLDDWGRTDAEGRPREMHLDAGFAVSRPAARPASIPPVLLPGTGTREILTACRYFALARTRLEVGDTQPVGWFGSPAVITLLEGNATIGSETLAAGESAVVWPGAAMSFGASEPVVALVAWVPDLETDIVGPARAAGVSSRSIAALAGETGDLPTSPAST